MVIVQIVTHTRTYKAHTHYTKSPQNDDDSKAYRIVCGHKSYFSILKRVKIDLFWLPKRDMGTGEIKYSMCDVS